MNVLDRFKDLLLKCSYHGFEPWRLVAFFFFLCMKEPLHNEMNHREDVSRELYEPRTLRSLWTLRLYC